MITYNLYPSLLFLSYNKDNAPAELPFEVASMDVQQFLSGSRGYQEMFGIMASLNSFGFTPTHYWINNLQFKDVEYNDNFRNNHFRRFVTNVPEKMQYGCICFKEGGQYVYLYLPPEKSKIKDVEGAYLATALFKENLFIGFEECVLNNGFSVMPTGHYEGGMDIGGYLSFVSVSLSFMANADKTLNDSLNNTREKIWAK